MVIRDSVNSVNNEIDIEDYIIHQPSSEKTRESLNEMQDMNSLVNNNIIMN